MPAAEVVPGPYVSHANRFENYPTTSSPSSKIDTGKGPSNEIHRCAGTARLQMAQVHSSHAGAVPAKNRPNGPLPCNLRSAKRWRKQTRKPGSDSKVKESKVVTGMPEFSTHHLHSVPQSTMRPPRTSSNTNLAIGHHSSQGSPDGA